LKVKADSGAGFEEATLPLLKDVQANEPGNLLYCLARHPQDPTTYIFTELVSLFPSLLMLFGQ
jgi:quinol monooxygenase YgiN